jgi:CRP-like cAMP-binding protein
MDTASVTSLPSLHDNHPRAARQNRRDASRAAFETALLKASDGRAALPSDVVDELADLARQRHCMAGAVVARRGHVADDVWLLGSGCVALGALGASGELDHVRAVHSEGWLDLAGALLEGGVYLEDIVCETDAELWQLPADALRACWRRQPILLQVLAGSLARQVRQLTVEARELMTKDALSRCAGWLLEHALPQPALAQGTGRSVEAAEVELRQRKRSIALQLGTTPETFSRMLSQLRSRGLIEVKGYHIVLLNLPGLRALAGM